MATPILTPAQAEAVYSAMCALNNVGGSVDASVPRQGKTAQRVIVRDMGHSIQVHIATARLGERETYADQSAFATAYGLQQG